MNPSDCPALGFVGKLVEQGYTSSNMDDTLKLSADPAKSTVPGRKIIRRNVKRDENGLYVLSHDEICAIHENTSPYVPSHYALKEMKVAEGPSTGVSFPLKFLDKKDEEFDLDVISTHLKAEMMQLPEVLRRLDPATPEEAYKVSYSNVLTTRRDQAIEKVQEAVAAGFKRYGVTNG